MRWHTFFFLVILTAGGARAEGDERARTCAIEFAPPVSASHYIPGSYLGRSFLAPANHLGVDIALPERTAVRAIADGSIAAYCDDARDYGELVVVIEHDLGEPRAFRNGNGETVLTQYLISIYGHLRRARERDGLPLPWRIGDRVQRGEVIGFVNDNEHNGLGREHLHLGVRLMDATQARAADPDDWFRGYDRYTALLRQDFASPTEVITSQCDDENDEGESEAESESESEPEPSPEPEPTNWFSLEWTVAGSEPAARLNLSGRIIDAERVWHDWEPWQETENSHRIFTTFPLERCEGVDFSGEATVAGETIWSCAGNEVIGTITARWNTAHLFPIAVPNGSGGCNLRLWTPCVVPGIDSDPEPEPEPEPLFPQTITCEIEEGGLAITVHGDLNDRTLIGGGLADGIRFISFGSDVTGWVTGTGLPEYFQPWLGAHLPHRLLAPIDVGRFNLWVAGRDNTRWFDLRAWEVSGADCALVPDGWGGLIIER